MAAPFTIDGQTYNVTVPVGGLKRSFEVMDGSNAGRMLSGDWERDVIGTFYNYTLQIESRKTTLEEYDALYEVLSSPQPYHDITFPYGQTTLSFRAYITSGSDSLIRISSGKNYWAGLTVAFTAKAPQRV